MNLPEIIKGCKSGKRRFQNALVHNYAPMLMAVCSRYCRDKEHAKDALQETFINIFKYIDSIKEINSAEAWMRKVAVTCCIAMYRKKVMPKYLEITPSVELLNIEIPEVFANLEVEELLQIIDQLPEGLRIVFNLHAVEGYSHKEIGDLLNIGVSTSRANLTRARKMIISILDKKVEDDYSGYYEKSINGNKT